MAPFAIRLISWQKQHGRKHLPWQSHDPYHIWLSEIMLQQTQVNTVIPYYHRFLACFPTIETLACASLDEVMAHWSGLGYYSRARNLHRAAQLIIKEYAGRFPSTQNELMHLPGVGRSTAAAIAAFAYSARTAILDGNVKRVLTRYQGIFGVTQHKDIANTLWLLAEALLPEKKEEMSAYTQGLMDLGSLICTRSKPLCALCPIKEDCYAFKHHAQTQLPTKKPKKVLPTRETMMLIIRDNNSRILLQKRPESGIWGGLWSLPEVATTQDAQIYCHQLGLENIELLPTMAEFTHTFTHYRLIITPQPLTIGKNVTLHQEHGQWVDIKKATDLGLPTPVRKLISIL